MNDNDNSTDDTRLAAGDDRATPLPAAARRQFRYRSGDSRDDDLIVTACIGPDARSIRFTGVVPVEVKQDYDIAVGGTRPVNDRQAAEYDACTAWLRYLTAEQRVELGVVLAEADDPTAACDVSRDRRTSPAAGVAADWIDAHGGRPGWATGRFSEGKRPLWLPPLLCGSWRRKKQTAAIDATFAAGDIVRHKPTDPYAVAVLIRVGGAGVGGVLPAVRPLDGDTSLCGVRWDDFLRCNIREAVRRTAAATT